jgi:hypothetical protein
MIVANKEICELKYVIVDDFGEGFAEGELQEDATCKDFLQVQQEGDGYEVNWELYFYPEGWKEF